jgi:Fe-S cluster assembly protein SufD
MLEAQTRFDSMKDTLPGDGAARAAALANAEAAGLPTRRVESWHYTDLQRLLKSESCDVLAAVNFANVDALMAVFENGVLDTPPQADGLTLTPFNGAAAIAETPMAQYNAALAQNGLVADVTGTLAHPLIITTAGGDDVHLAHKITLAEGAKAVLVDNHMAEGYTNAVFDITLGAGASLTLIRMQQAGRQIGQSRVQLAEGAHYGCVALALGGALARHEAEIVLNAAGAHAELHSAVLGRAGHHADFTYVIDHAAADTSSNTTAYNVLDSEARGVFQGKVIVRPDAQHVEAEMQARAMMLGAGAEMDAKPELEIYADDVACAHGSAIGELDRDALFFLRARGLDEATARHLLVAAFVEQVTAHIGDGGLQEILRGLIEQKISGLLDARA